MLQCLPESNRQMLYGFENLRGFALSYWIDQMQLAIPDLFSNDADNNMREFSLVLWYSMHDIDPDALAIAEECVLNMLPWTHDLYEKPKRARLQLVLPISHRTGGKRG
jgi:hypothetical protein